jgi:hypothetical protein
METVSQESILLWSLVGGVALATLFAALFMLKDWLVAAPKSRVVATFKYCFYLGGSVARQVRITSVCTMTLRKDVIEFGGWQWRGAEPFVIPLERIETVRQFKNSESMSLEGIEFVEDAGTYVSLSTAKGTTSNVIVIYWSDGDGQKCRELVIFPKAYGAAEMRRQCMASEGWRGM